MTIQERIQRVITDPSTSYALRAYLETALVRDPVDMANELDVASHLANMRCVELLGPVKAAYAMMQHKSFYDYNVVSKIAGAP